MPFHFIGTGLAEREIVLSRIPVRLYGFCIFCYTDHTLSLIRDQLVTGDKKNYRALYQMKTPRYAKQKAA
jgi:hypothetical protein